MKNVKSQVTTLQSVIDQLQKSAPDMSENCPIMDSPTLPRASSITIMQYNNANQSSCGEQIPQLDGINQLELQSIPDQNSEFKCETCDKVFESEKEFKNHDSFQFCCDDCGICFSTQLASHFHELQEHPESHYAEAYIPESTKLMFASNQPKKK